MTPPNPDTETMSSLPRPEGAGLAAADRLGRRVLYLLVVVVASAIAGFAVAFVPLPLLIGAVVAAFLAFLLVRNPYLGLLAYLIIFSLRLAELVPALEPLRPEKTVGLLTFGLLVLMQVKRHGGLAFDASRQTKHFYFLILAAFLSVPFAYYRGGAMEGVVDFIKLLVFYLLIVHLVNTRARLRGFVYLHCALVGYLAVDSTVRYATGALLHAQGIDRALGATSIASGPNELGATMATTIPVFLLLGLSRGRGPVRNLLLIGLGLMVFTLILTGSRSAFIGFIASFGYFAWQSRHRVLFMIAGVLMVAGLFAVMPEQYKGRYSTITRSELDGSSMERIKVWKKGMQMVADRPLTGVGVHCFGAANAYTYSTGRPSWLESHSLYVQVPAEMGLIGAFAFFSFMFAFLRLNRRASRQLADEDDDWDFERALIQGMFAGYVALLFTGIFGHSMMRETWYLYAALGLATLRIYVDARPDLDPEKRAALLR
jgi:probable O-glycosylation ligase (exosortase A-associated)